MRNLRRCCTISLMTWTRRDWGKASAAAAAAGLLAACSSDGDSAAEQDAGRESGDSARPHVFDMHCDTPSRMLSEGLSLGERRGYHQVDIPRMREGGLSASYFAIFTPAGDKTELEALKKALEIADLIVEEVSRYPDDLTLAVSADDIERCRRENKIAILLSLEGGHMLASSLSVLREFYRLGVRSMTLVHSQSTSWARSAESGKGPAGLTDFGQDVVREMNRLGMVIDTSHGADRLFADAVAASKAPIMASHSCCRAVADHPRNLTDDQLKALAANGGMIAIAYYNGLLVDGYGAPRPDLGDLEARRRKIREKLADDPPSMSRELWKVSAEEAERFGKVPFEKLLDHFEHAAKVAGVDHVGFGSDLDGAGRHFPEEINDIAKTPNLAAGLRKRGFSEDDVGKILGGNAMRVLREVENISAGETGKAG